MFPHQSTLIFLLKIESYKRYVVLKIEIKIENMKNLWFQIPTKVWNHTMSFCETLIAL
jgi:hypothetical protein